MQISFFDVIQSFFNGNIFSHLWFLYALAGLYLAVPVLVWLIDPHDRLKVYYFVSLWFIGASLIPLCNQAMTYVTGREINAALDLAMFGGCSGYLVLGFFIGSIPLTRAHRWIAAVCLAVGVALTVLATSFITSMSGVFIGYFYSYLSPNVVLASVGAFVLLRHLGKK